MLLSRILQGLLTRAQARQLGLLALTTTLLGASITSADDADSMYKSIDANGNVTYSDTPSGKKIEPVDLPQINTTPAVETGRHVRSAPEPESPRYSISITSPQQEAQVLPGQRTLNISTEISPEASRGYTTQLLLNGTPYGPAQQGNNFSISEITRGEHQIAAVLRNEKGRVIARSNNVTVYVLRARR